MSEYSTTTEQVEKLTLDTHVMLWYNEGIKLSQNHIQLIEDARKRSSLYICSISLWEIASLEKTGKIAFSISLDEWIQRVLSIPGLNLIDLSTSILMQSCSLPNYSHNDPADRFIIASARATNSHLMSFDQHIINYAHAGYLKIALT